jgi:hypothetical protein
MTRIRLTLLAALLLACTACRAPEPPPTDEPPEPQASADSVAA